MKYILIVAIYILSCGMASAKCATWTNSDLQKVQHASSIFVARLVSAHLKEQKNDVMLVYGQYHLLDILKGSPPKEGIVQSSLSDVGIPLTPGFVYLLFIYDASPQVDWCSGSRLLKEYYAPYPNEDKKIIQHIKDLLTNPDLPAFFGPIIIGEQPRWW